MLSASFREIQRRSHDEEDFPLPSAHDRLGENFILALYYGTRYLYVYNMIIFTRHRNTMPADLRRNTPCAKPLNIVLLFGISVANYDLTVAAGSE